MPEENSKNTQTRRPDRNSKSGKAASHDGKKTRSGKPRTAASAAKTLTPEEAQKELWQ